MKRTKFANTSQAKPNLAIVKSSILQALSNQDLKNKVETINEIRGWIHELSPFKNEPVDFVRWVPLDNVIANDYNPNKVAPPEMELLEVSIMNDGYTQPIVTFPEKGKVTVVDGFHRNRVGKESKIVKDRIKGFLPIVAIRNTQSSKNDRIASTIRHNRARGKHQISGMSEIVIELKNRNWTNGRISRELGMDQDEILRLCQITGLESLFKDDDFSRAWLTEDSEYEGTFTDEVTEEEKEEHEFRTVNTSDENRIFHTYDKWECYKAGFYDTHAEGKTKDQCEQEYCDFLSDDKAFRKTLRKVTTEWVHSCEHYLTNSAMNRIAWLGQASVCYARGIPSEFRGGFNRLSPEQQDKANRTALRYLNKWLKDNGLNELTLNEALANRQMELY